MSLYLLLFIYLFGLQFSAFSSATNCNDGEVRLADKVSDFEGRVEVCYNGVWGTICDNNWGREDAEVVCKELHLPTTFPEALIRFGGGSGPIHFSAFKCIGIESQLLECNSQATDIVCSHYQDAGVKCSNESCTENEIELNGGLLQICHNSKWGLVCLNPNLNNLNEAKAACQELGWPSRDARSFDYDALDIDGFAILNGIICSSAEKNFTDCHNAEEYGEYQCQHYAGVHCAVPQQCNETGAIRLTHGDKLMFSSYYSIRGRLEVCSGGQWGSVCYSDKTTNNIATVACRELNYIAKGFVGEESQYHKDLEVVPIIWTNLMCKGNEESITNCSYTELDENHNCIQNDNIIVSCNSRRYKETEIYIYYYDNTVEICQEGHWNLLCGDNWGYKEALVVCTQLGMIGIPDPLKVHEYYNPQNHFVCSGNESKLSECEYTQRDCVSETLAGVMCPEKNDGCENGEVRLQDDFSGRLEICQYNTWGAVCTKNWDDDDARVVCRQLGYDVEDAKAMKGFEIQDNEPVFLSEVECNGLEQMLAMCSSYELVGDSCSQRDIVGVTCGNSTGGGIQESSGGKVAVIGSLLCFVAVLTIMVLLVILTYKLRKKQQVERMQMDILVPGSSSSAVDSGVGINEGSTHESNKDGPHINPYSVSYPASDSNLPGKSSVGLNEGTRMRINSRYMRELTHGKFLIKYEQITQLENIGQGEFGIVYRGRLDLPGRAGQEVAIKTLKGDFDQLDVDKIAEESLKMSRFKHTHVMGLIGVCLDAGPAPYIVMPFMANGSLLKYLKRERESLVLLEGKDEDEVQDVCKRLMVMCSQIASGMEYLAQEKYIHRDLAARNCMIDSHFVIRITDFGLSEDVFVRNYFRQGESEDVVKLPVKWMGPESLSDGHFSEKSDVWSYGVTMWEIFSGGKTPYPGTDPVTLMRMLEEGDRMPKPNHAACSEEIYVMMRKCWEMIPEKRPSFKELRTNTSKYIEHIAGYLDLGFNPFAAAKRAKSVAEEKHVENEN